MINLLAVSKIVNPQIINSLQNVNAEVYVNRIVSSLIFIGFVICIVAFILLFLIGGAQWIMSGGDKQSLENAKSKIVNAATGLVILFLLWFILQLINVLFHINIGRLGIPASGGGSIGGGGGGGGIPPTGVVLSPTPTGVVQGVCAYNASLTPQCRCLCNSGYVPQTACSGTTSTSCVSNSCLCKQAPIVPTTDPTIGTCVFSGGLCSCICSNTNYSVVQGCPNVGPSQCTSQSCVCVFGAPTTTGCKTCFDGYQNWECCGGEDCGLYYPDCLVGP